MKKELTDEVLEALGSCMNTCGDDCKARGVCLPGQSYVRRKLATALLEERARPKVWAFAPEWANAARVSFFVNDRNDGHSEVFSGTYTRELPKTRTRIMAEEIASAHISNKDDLIDIIEQTINAHMEELKGEA